MQSLRKTAVVAARASRTTLPRQPRRYAHDEHSHGHGHGPVNEPMGKGFWFTMLTIPAGWAVYFVSRNSDDNTQPFFTRMIEKYTDAQDKWARRNDIHVRMIEQAGDDRVLFMNTKPQEFVDMKFPEIMNVGSPYNVPAGSQVQMDKVIEKYKKLAYEENERKLEALRNNEIKSEQPFKKNYIRKAPDALENSPRQSSRLSPFRKRKAIPAHPVRAPLLPELGFNSHRRNDMNGLVSTSSDAPHTAHTGPLRPINSNSVMPAYTSPRNVSGPLAVESALMASDPLAPGSQWARPNPHANPLSSQNNSKTSQYIDKITSENDRLRRELRAEKLAREDETKRVSAARSKAEDSRTELQHLQVLADTNERAIERKDRKLEELKATLEAEANRRRVAEQRAEEALRMLGDTRSETQRQLSTAYEMQHMAETNLETAREGFKRIGEGYEKKVRYMTEQLNELRQSRNEDADKIKRQAIISDQLNHELSRAGRTDQNRQNLMVSYKEEHQKQLDGLVEEAQKMRLSLPEKEREAEKLIQSLKETRDKMKWVMTQHRRQGGT
ncbi:hypothetical protein P153DRAFT_284319 [Dothidotthia symphoricarpi CBS 119687]|uniref:Uncharacterized protein n=1 Tax=Dothidotthia symphoricarpi CBS 119687 TaxID=1392245 RepID=A0A6A6APD1_9PLEO|nr:uncharacterized protein P153DRAFT_284319 [Dothidotthia symphoricarpi CBS 119687]KAF2133043.1 hypothetical protein P153DRAFT_284319 [Dothidotthia symphoricarpi CBS 119687]